MCLTVVDLLYDRKNQAVNQDLVANAANLVSFVLETKRNAEADPRTAQPELISEEFLASLKSTEMEVERYMLQQPPMQ